MLALRLIFLVTSSNYSSFSLVCVGSSSSRISLAKNTTTTIVVVVAIIVEYYRGTPSTAAWGFEKPVKILGGSISSYIQFHLGRLAGLISPRQHSSLGKREKKRREERRKKIENDFFNQKEIANFFSFFSWEEFDFILSVASWSKRYRK